MFNAITLLAAAASAFVTGPGPVQTLGKPLVDDTFRGGLVSDGERYFAFPLAPGGKVRLYDTRRRRSITMNAACAVPAEINRRGRFLFSCGSGSVSATAEVVTAATRRVRRLTAQDGPEGVAWLGVGSRYAIYFRRTVCDSGGCGGDVHVVDLHTGTDQVRSAADPYCPQTDFDVPRADGAPCPAAGSAARYTLEVDPSSFDLVLLDRGRVSRTLATSPSFQSGSEEIAQGWVTWTEIADGVMTVRAASVNGKRRHAWRTRLPAPGATERVGRWVAVIVRYRVYLLPFLR